MENNSNSQKTKILTEFDTVIDLDLGLMKLVQEKYNNPKYIDQRIMHLSLHDVKQELLNRTHECPLSICIKDIETAKSLYMDFIDTKYDEILENHSKTGVFKLMKTYDNADNMEVTILCSSQKEADIVHYYSKTMKTLVKKHDQVDIKNYGVYFLKSLPRIFVFNGKFYNVHIFIMGYMYNLYRAPDGILFPNPAIAKSLIPDNRIGIVDVYEKSENIHLINKQTEETKNDK